MTKLLGTVATVLLLAASFSSGAVGAGKGPPPAGPVTCDEVPMAAYCDAELQNLCYAIQVGGFTNDRDRFNLIGKVIETAMKINDGKFSDADQKLDNIQTKVDQLADAAKPKLDADSAYAITVARIEASLCVSALGG